MKNKELIALLQQADPEEQVSFQIDDGCCGEFIELNCYDEEHYWSYNKETKKFDVPGSVVLRFTHLPGYQSCIQSGATRKAHNKYWAKTEEEE